MATKTRLKIRKERFSDLVERLSDLTGISDTVKLKIDNEHIMMYSTLGGQVLLAFKNYLINTKEYLDYEDLEYTIDVVIVNAKKFVKNLNFLMQAEKLTIDITHKPSADDDTVMVARGIQINGGRLKVNWIAGEHYAVRDIGKSILQDRLDLRLRKWNFIVGKDDFNDIKKLSTINEGKLLNIFADKGKVTISENAAWELEVSDCDPEKTSNMILNKKFLKSIDDSKDVDFSIFENFMLIKDEETNLMLSYEQDFSEEDE